MGDIERWKLMADWVMPAQGGPAQPLTVVIGPRPEPGERIEVVRLTDYEGAVEALDDLRAIVNADPPGRAQDVVVRVVDRLAGRAKWGAVDMLGDIEHCWALVDDRGKIAHVLWRESTAADMAARHGYRMVELVPASQLQGAVGVERERILKMIDAAADLAPDPVVARSFAGLARAIRKGGQ